MVERIRAELVQRVEELLVANDNSAYEELLRILRRDEYQQIIRKTTGLGYLREMIERWNIEKEEGVSYIFQDISNLEQVEYAYLNIKHGLWRIEQGLSEEKCLPFVEKMSQKQQSKYLLVWIAHANLKEPERALAYLSECMMKYNEISALETLSYGLILYPESQELLLQKAQCLMALNVWQEALKTLLLIKEPSIELQLIIEELQCLVK